MRELARVLRLVCTREGYWVRKWHQADPSSPDASYASPIFSSMAANTALVHLLPNSHSSCCM